MTVRAWEPALVVVWCGVVWCVVRGLGTKYRASRALTVEQERRMASGQVNTDTTNTLHHHRHQSTTCQTHRSATWSSAVLDGDCSINCSNKMENLEYFIIAIQI